MNDPKALALTHLRDKNSSRETFRKAAATITHLLAYETLKHCAMKSIPVETPLGSAHGMILAQPIMLVPVVRSGMTMLAPFLDYFPDASIGVVGLKRDEKTAQAHWYYHNLPPVQKNQLIIILDPMIATGGTALNVLTMLQENGIPQKSIFFTAIIGSLPGITNVKNHFPDVTLIIAAHDADLNSDKFITPGLGDFGDRYFGTL